MIFNREKRIKYLGFDDTRFTITGILIVSFITNYLFNDSFGQKPIVDEILTWIISLFFTFFNWFVMRSFIIYSRKKFPKYKDNIKRIIIVLVVMLISIIVINNAGNFILGRIFGSQYNPALFSRIILPIAIISTMILAIYEAVFYYVQLQTSIRNEEQSKQMIVQAQLDALRNQAQPHFLFNSFTTLRDIIDKNTKEEAKNFVDKLSDVYRFILESGDKDLILLEKEIKFSKAYIHIQKERFGDNLIVNWNVSDEHISSNIAPMSIQLLLENAIKHNIVSRSKPLTIDIESDQNQIIVRNKIQPKSSQLPSTKLGLKNIQKRYALISDRNVKIEKTETTFSVLLPIIEKISLK